MVSWTCSVSTNSLSDMLGFLIMVVRKERGISQLDQVLADSQCLETLGEAKRGAVSTHVALDCRPRRQSGAPPLPQASCDSAVYTLHELDETSPNEPYNCTN